MIGNNNYILKEGEDLITKFEYLKEVPGYIGIKDINGQYKGISRDASLLLGWDSIDEVMNKTDYEIPSEASEAAELFINVDKKTIHLMQNITAIEIFFRFGSITAILVCKSPIFNSDKKTVGVLWNGTDITNFITNQYQWLDSTDRKFIVDLKAPKQYILTPEASPLPLTERQQACLSLLIRGKTIKEIAFILGISNRTVEDHINAMKYKLGCNNKSQLIEKAIDSGFLFHLSGTLFGTCEYLYSLKPR